MLSRNVESYNHSQKSNVIGKILPITLRTEPATEPAQADWCGRQEGDPQPIVYFGCHATDAKTLQSAGLNAFCLSYYEIERGNEKYVTAHPGFTNPKCRSFLDSGAFSFLVMGAKGAVSEADLHKRADAYVVRYADWVRKHREKFDFYITFDYRVDAKLTWDVTQKLRKLGIAPTPVYHGDASIDWLKRYIDEGHKLICLSKRFFLNNRRGLLQFYDHVFNLCGKHDVAVHGLACTGREAWRYPFYSVDSSSLVKNYGSLTWWDDHEVQQNVAVGRSSQGSFGRNLLDLLASCNLTLDEVSTERQKRLFFNATMLKRFLDSRTKKPMLRKQLF